LAFSIPSAAPDYPDAAGHLRQLFSKLENGEIEMGIPLPRSLVTLQPIWKRTLLAGVLALAIVASLGGSVKPAKAAVADLLILSTTITKPDVHGNALSVEEQEAAALGLSVNIVTPVQWAAMTTADFAAYKAIVLGDPTCVVGDGGLAAPVANGAVWGPAVDGNIEVLGTDPTYHTEFGPFTGPRQVVHSGLNFAASSGTGKTGAYISLSCYYHNATPGVLSPVPVLNAFETVPGQFTAASVGCYNDSHIVATSAALTGLTDANLSNWSCSVHEAFNTWASDFVVLAIARNIGTAYTAPDGSVGTPYIIARGNISAGDISLDPPTQTVCPGASATVTAKVTSGGTPTPGVTVTFTVNSGPNAGTTGTGVTNASGEATFSYSGTLAGTDSLTASFTDSTGHLQTSKPVAVIWGSCEQAITASGTTFSAVEGQSFSGPVATFTDPATASTPGEYSASIDWGDASASSAGTISGSGGNFTVSGTHTYAEEGQYHPTVTITDTDNSSNTATANSTANVADAALTATGACLSTSQQFYNNGPTATFTDAAFPSGTLSDFSASINWGDLSANSAGTVSGPVAGVYTVRGTHTYATTGNHTITTTITDVGGSTATKSCSTLAFAFPPGGGSFVIGDRNAAVGNTVTFWGAQWSKINSLSGGTAPAAFKGFAEKPHDPGCNINWSADTGSSTPPPQGPLPAFMGVIVTSSASQSGSTISGNTVHIVIVQTNPGYAPNAGHAGTGTVVAVTAC
jgi:hypothetical protein